MDLRRATHNDATATAPDMCSFAGNTDYQPANGTVDDAIGQAKAAITVTPYSVTFDGNGHTATGTATGVTGEDLSSLLDLSNTTHTDAASYAGDKWTLARNND